MRVNMLFNDDLLKRLDEEAKKYSITRTAFVNMALTAYLNQQELMKKTPEMLETLSQIMSQAMELKKSLPVESNSVKR